MLDAKVAVLAVTVAGAAGALGFGALRAHAHGGFRGHRDHAMLEKFVTFAVSEKLDAIQASDAQKQRVLEIKDRLLSEGKALHRGRGAFHTELLGLLAGDEPDPARIRALVRKRTQAFTRLAEDATSAVIELHGVFTPEQRRQLMGDLQQHLERHQD